MLHFRKLKYYDYDDVAFYCQQAVEKGLKALYITKFQKAPPKVHDLTLLCDHLANVPETIRHAGEKLTPPISLPDILMLLTKYLQSFILVNRFLGF